MYLIDNSMLDYDKHTLLYRIDSSMIGTRQLHLANVDMIPGVNFTPCTNTIVGSCLPGNYSFEILRDYLSGGNYCCEILRDYLSGGNYRHEILRNYLSGGNYCFEILRNYLFASNYCFEILRN